MTTTRNRNKKPADTTAAATMKPVNIPAEISRYMRAIGARGVAGRLARLIPAQRRAIARAGGLARQAKARADKSTNSSNANDNRTVE